MKEFLLSAPCHFGLESVLSGEVKRIGGQDIKTVDGRGSFTGPAQMIATANLWLRTAERVQLVLGCFAATSFEQLFEGVRALPFEDFIGREDAFPVKGWSLNSQLHSVPDCQSIIKKAAAKRMEGAYGQSWFAETGAKVQIQFSILKDSVTILLDTSGAGLHKRGYRPEANQAPIKETLAAGILDLARIYPDTQIYDPLCGSGTFLIEAALKGFNIAPGLRRRFAAEHWGCLDAGIWQQERKAAAEGVRKTAAFRAWGGDIDLRSVQLTLDNAKRAGVGSRVQAEAADISGFKLPEGRSLVVCNPPYGERMLQVQEAEALYQTMGQVFEPREDITYCIISPHKEFETFFGRRADKRRKLYNGMIECQLYLYLASKRY